VELAKDRQRLSRKRDDVLDMHFHPPRRDAPLRPVEIEFHPLRLTQLSRTHEYVRRQTQSGVGCDRPGVPVDGSQEFADALGLGNAREVAAGGWRERSSQIRRRIPLCAPRSHRIAEYLPAVLVNPMRRIQRTSLLHAPQAGQQLRGGDLADGTRAQPRKHIHLQAAENFARVTPGPIGRKLPEPLARHRLEAVRLRGFLRLPPDPRITPGGQFAPSLVAPVPGFLESDFWIDAERQ